MSHNCLFCRIVEGEVPSKKVFENDEFLAFHDINPAAPMHLLLIPKQHISSMQEVTPSDAGWLGRMMALAPQLALENGARPGLEGGFRLVINTGDDGCQEIHHIHLHIIGGERPWASRTNLAF